MSGKDGIAEFWAWWSSAHAQLEREIETGELTEALVAEIGRKVGAIDAALVWELVPGQTADHAFCISGGGDLEKRLLTETWRTRGPAPHTTWEFHAARQAVGAREVLPLLGGLEIDSLLVAFELDDSSERAHAIVFHPAFADLDPEVALRIAFLALDAVFGEDDVERWLGMIDVVGEEPDHAKPMAFLVEAVRAMAMTATGEQFAVLHGDDNGAPSFATVNLALKRIDHLPCRVHVSVDLALLSPEDGLTTADEADALDTLEDELTELLGTTVAYFGRETSRGRRVIHYFAPEDGVTATTIEVWRARHPERDVVTTFTRDLAWDAMRRFI